MTDEKIQVLVCLQCAMKALVEGREEAAIEETVEAHMARRHPDPVACHAEREDLEDKLALLVHDRLHPDATRH